MKRGPKQDPVRGRVKDPVIAAGEKEARDALRGVLSQFVQQFGYKVVKGELLAVKHTKGPSILSSKEDVLSQSDPLEAISLSHPMSRLELLKEPRRRYGETGGETLASPDIEKARRVAEKFEYLQQVWFAVERIRRSESPTLTAKEACRRLAARGGIGEAVSGGRLGVARVVSRTTYAATIVRKFKRAERLLRDDDLCRPKMDRLAQKGPIRRKWEQMLAEIP